MRRAALTFDDGPSEWTPPILDLLAAHDAHATFFVLGTAIAGREATLQRIVKEGHEVAVHGWDHTPCDDLPEDVILMRLADTCETIARQGETVLRWWRPPWHRVTDDAASAAERLGLDRGERPAGLHAPRAHRRGRARPPRDALGSVAVRDGQRAPRVRYEQIPCTGWRLGDEACALLDTLIREHEPELIVECGSGKSTAVLAEVAATYGGRVIALEHDPKWLHETAELIHICDASADLRLAPLNYGDTEPFWYAKSAWEDLDGIGMLVVDGPPNFGRLNARRPAVPLLRDKMLPGCLVILDDLQRKSEREAIAEWGIEMTIIEHNGRELGWGTLDG